MYLPNPLIVVDGKLEVGQTEVQQADLDYLLWLFQFPVIPSPGIEKGVRHNQQTQIRSKETTALFAKIDYFIYHKLREWKQSPVIGVAREQIIRYQVGEYESLHTDDYFKPSKEVGETKEGFHLLNQVVGLLYFSTPDLIGGELLVGGESIAPISGRLVAFPCNFRFPHQVTPVERGTRIALVRHYFIKD